MTTIALREALERHAVERAAYRPPLPMPNREKLDAAQAELRDILNQECDVVCSIVASAIEDPTTSRVSLRSIRVKGRGGEQDTRFSLFFSVPREFEVVDVLRAWVREHFGALMRVEGDPVYAGYVFEFS